MSLFHFSDNPSIKNFVPRPVTKPVERRAGWEWLNGPLVWATHESHDFLYLFPRECPRILIWPTPTTSPKDLETWFGDSQAKILAFVERRWVNQIQSSVIYRYEFAKDTFEDIGDVGMWVSKSPVQPLGTEALSDLPAHIRSRKIDLRVLDDLTELRKVWESTLHASGIRLRNAKNWGPPGWPHSKP